MWIQYYEVSNQIITVYIILRTIHYSRHWEHNGEQHRSIHALQRYYIQLGVIEWGRQLYVVHSFIYSFTHILSSSRKHLLYVKWEVWISNLVIRSVIGSS